MGREVINLPPGFRFKPRDDELINYYLKPKVMGRQLPCKIINDDIQVYAPDSTPWLLFDLDDPHSWIDSITTAEKTLYVFTSLSKLATHDSNNTTTRTRCNTSKKAGCGTWVQRTKRIPIIDGDGNVIGGKRMLNFEIHDIEARFDVDKAVYFKMHEYSLWGVNDSLGSEHGGHLVLCEITFDPSKRTPFKLANKTTTHQVSRRGRKAQNIRQNKKNLQESATPTSKSVAPVMNSTSLLHPQSSVSLDGGVCNYDWSATAPYDIVVQNLDESDSGALCFDDQAGEDLESFDITGFMQYMESNPEVEPLQDRTICELGKRKSAEGDNSCQAKKMCF